MDFFPINLPACQHFSSLPLTSNSPPNYATPIIKITRVNDITRLGSIIEHSSDWPAAGPELMTFQSAVDANQATGGRTFTGKK